MLRKLSRGGAAKLPQKEGRMEYYKYHGERWSDIAGEKVGVLEYRSKDKYPYCDCSRCGKPIINRMFVIQSCETDIELFYLGSECIKKFS